MGAVDMQFIQHHENGWCGCLPSCDLVRKASEYNSAPNVYQLQTPVDCKLSDWADDGDCDAKCGLGTKQQVRKVVTKAAFGGKACPTEEGELILTQVVGCKADPCPDADPVYALVDGAPDAGKYVEEILNPDPNKPLGEVQCCKEGEEPEEIVCTRRSPWDSSNNGDCLSGHNDKKKFTLSEAIGMCSKLGSEWSLCTRSAVKRGVCQGTGCNHDQTLVWVRDDNDVTYGMLREFAAALNANGPMVLALAFFGLVVLGHLMWARFCVKKNEQFQKIQDLPEEV